MSGYAVVTVLHDSAAELPALLASLAACSPPPAQIIAVDAGSSDQGPALAADAGCTVLVAGDVGFGAANNRGLEAVSEPVTLLLNPDIVALDPAAAGRLAALASEFDALHVPRLLNADGTIQDSAHPLPGTIGALLPALVPPRLLPPAVRERVAPWRSQRARTVGWAIAAAVCARTDTLRRIGPFDAGQFLFFEDLDLCLRARAAGVPTVLHPELRMVHLGGHSTGPAYGGEPHTLLARRRREVIGARLGGRALALDDAAQALTFSTRATGRCLLGRSTGRPLAQLRALHDARRGDHADG